MDEKRLSEIRLRQCRATTSMELIGHSTWMEAYAADVAHLLVTLDDFTARHDTLMPIIKDKTKRIDELAMMNNVLAYQYLARRVESLIQQNDELKRELKATVAAYSTVHADLTAVMDAKSKAVPHVITFASIAEPEGDDEDNEDDVFTETGHPVACCCSTATLMASGCQCGSMGGKCDPRGCSNS